MGPESWAGLQVGAILRSILEGYLTYLALTFAHAASLARACLRARKHFCNLQLTSRKKRCVPCDATGTRATRIRRPHDYERQVRQVASSIIISNGALVPALSRPHSGSYMAMQRSSASASALCRAGRLECLEIWVVRPYYTDMHDGSGARLLIEDRLTSCGSPMDPPLYLPSKFCMYVSVPGPQ